MSHGRRDFVKLRLQTLKQGKKNFLDYPVVLNVITLAFKMEVGEKRVNWRDSAGEAGEI